MLAEGVFFVLKYTHNYLIHNAEFIIHNFLVLNIQIMQSVLENIFYDYSAEI